MNGRADHQDGYKYNTLGDSPRTDVKMERRAFLILLFSRLCLGIALLAVGAFGTYSCCVFASGDGSESFMNYLFAVVEAAAEWPQFAGVLILVLLFDIIGCLLIVQCFVKGWRQQA
jgi:hypothetical protein